MSMQTALKSAAVLALGALALTACQAGTTGTSAASAPSSASSSGAGAAPVSAPSAPAGSTTGSVSGSGSGSGAGSAGSSSGTAGSGADTGGSTGGDAAGDSYAYTHPCAPQQLSVHVARRASAPSQRVITVRNLGTHSCGLSYFPLVSIDSAQSADHSQAVKPLIPSGLGGAPAYPVHPGRTAYAVIDLDPSGATTGTVAGVDELNILADGDHMPNAATLNFPLGSGTRVLKPKLGLYEATISDAVSSMRTADTQS